MQVSNRFVRNLRTQMLDDGIPRPGFEHTAQVLMQTVRAMQDGAYDYAIDYAMREGIDLNTVYTEYQAARKLGNTWKRLELALRKWGGRLPEGAIW